MGPFPGTKIPARERLIYALDAENAAAARATIERLGDAVVFYKVGLSLVFDPGFRGLFDFLAARGKKAFADIKFFDVPETVKAAVKQVAASSAAFATVHAQEAMMRAALEARAEAGDGERRLKILAVTVLTSLDRSDLEAMGFPPVAVGDLVVSRARRMLELGCDGVVASGLELPRLRREIGDGFLVVVPGIRPVANVDDQKRTIDVEEAFRQGADYVVIGRPIRQAPDPRAAAEEIQRRIESLFAARA